MKKYISIILAVLMLISCMVPLSAFAADDMEDDAYFTQEEFEALEHIYAITIQPMATGLITSNKLGIAKSGSNLLISGYTYGSSEVVKCGFTKVVVQRKTASATSWSDYKTYEDLYSSSNKYTLSKSVAVTSGYQYRVTATHYAKKSLLSKQKITSTTSYLSF